MDVVSDLGLDGDLAGRVVYTGYLGRAVAPSTAPHRGRSRIIACTGGGVDGGAVLEAFVRALRGHAKRFDRPLVAGGPLLSDSELARLRSLARGSTITVARFVLDLDQRIADSDLVVTMPGYNTTC